MRIVRLRHVIKAAWSFLAGFHARLRLGHRPFTIIGASGRGVSLAILTGALAVACDIRGPFEVAHESVLPNQATTSAGSVLTEEFEVTFLFDASDPRRLAEDPQDLQGESFRIQLEQSFEPSTRILTVSARIANVGGEPVWRPIRLTMSELRPASVVSVNADNGLDRIGAQWDFGQSH